MSSHDNGNKICEWFGHDAESLGRESELDFPSERFECKRCKESYSINAWAGAPQPPKIRKFAFWCLVAACLAGLIMMGK